MKIPNPKELIFSFLVGFMLALFAYSLFTLWRIEKIALDSAEKVDKIYNYCLEY